MRTIQEKKKEQGKLLVGVFFLTYKLLLKLFFKKPFQEIFQLKKQWYLQKGWCMVERFQQNRAQLLDIQNFATELLVKVNI